MGMGFGMHGFVRRALLRGDEENKPTQPLGKIFRRLFGYTWAYRRPLLAAGACVTLISLLNLVVPQMMRYTIDVVIPERRFDLIPFVVGGILLTALTSGFLAYGQSYLMSVVGQNVIYHLRNTLYRHIQNLSFSFFDNRRTGELMSRVTNDVQSLQQLITSGVLEIFVDLFTFLVIISVLFWIDWQLTLLLLFTFPLMIITTRLFGRRIRSAYKEVQMRIAGVNEHLQDTIASIRLVKSFANEDYEVKRFSERNRENMEANVKAVRLWATFFPTIDVMNHLGTVIILGFGARQVMMGRLSVGTLVAFIAYLQQLHRPVRRFSRIMNVIQQAAASAERIFEILDTRPDVYEKPGAIELPPLSDKIEYKGVTFSYDKRKPAVQDVNLTIKAGMTVAFVGPSGAGKTTLINLLARFYDTDAGTITIDGHDVRDVTLASLRGQMGIVSQEITLLHGTVRENIAYGKPDATDEEIEKAARAANAHEFIMTFPKGYDTPIGERGVRLSGGQRQRIAIARALLKDPRILILDEATSQLDSESEHLIQEALARLFVGRTNLVIAHRLSTIQNADLIVVMDKGRVVEQGTHEELLARGGRYAALHAAQFKEDEGDAEEAADGELIRPGRSALA